MSFDPRLAQDAIAKPPGILLRVNDDPHFLAGRGMLQQQVAPFPVLTSMNPAAFNLRITSPQVTPAILNLPLGFVNAAQLRTGPSVAARANHRWT